jgi:hypothetical protein
MSRRGATIAFILALASVPALAQDEGSSAGSDADISGEWSFEAAPVYDGCTFHGTASISLGTLPGEYQCSIVARDICPTAWDHTAKETCIAKRSGDTLTITSILDTVDPPTDSYYPDNFSLTIVDGAHMSGALLTVPYNTNARFHREVGPVS